MEISASTIKSERKARAIRDVRLSVVCGFPLLALHAVRALGREESTTALFAATVAFAVFPSDGAAKAVHQARQEKTSGSSPHESESLDANLGGLAVTLEGITALDEDGTLQYS